MLKLDLGYKGKLDPDIAVLFNDIAEQLRGSFTQIVSELSEPMKGEIDWWVANPASRNTLASPFFHYYCVLYLVDELFKKNYNISEIIVDSFALEKIIKKYIHLHGKSIPIKFNGKRIKLYFKNFVNPFIRIPFELFRHIYQFRCAQKTNQLQKPIPNKPLTLIDVFVEPGYISKDRYYNGLWENLNNKQRESTFFVPTFSGIPAWEILSAYEELRMADRNYLIKEDYLKISDLVYAVGHYLRRLKIKISPTIVLGVEISPLVKEELRSMRGYSSAVESLLNYRFSKRLKEHKTKLYLIIDYFENQVLDKGWNAGFNLHYPKITSLGYVGYVPPFNYLCCFPSKIESDCNLLPSVIGVIGSGFKKTIKKYAPDISVIEIPAFRFQHLWKQQEKNEKENDYSILIALTANLAESINILNIVIEYINSSKSKEYYFYVKVHPIIKINILKKVIGNNLPNNIQFRKDDISDSLIKSNIVITGMSSVALESLALGLNVIIIESRSGLSYNSIPEEIPKDLWRLCHKSRDLQTAIHYFHKKDENLRNDNRNVYSEIKEKYFMPVTKKNVRNLLMLGLP